MKRRTKGQGQEQEEGKEEYLFFNNFSLSFEVKILLWHVFIRFRKVECRPNYCDSRGIYVDVIKFNIVVNILKMLKSSVIQCVKKTGDLNFRNHT